MAKLRDYHGSFKIICDNFSIDLTEFEQIFASNETSFVIWDTDNNGLIDSLELFAGLIIFSDSKFEDKFRCRLIIGFISLMHSNSSFWYLWFQWGRKFGSVGYWIHDIFRPGFNIQDL